MKDGTGLAERLLGLDGFGVLEVDPAGDVHRGVGAAGGQEGVSSMSYCSTAPMRSGSSTSGVPCSTTAFITVHQHTPTRRRQSTPAGASSPTWRQASAPARRVSTTWASTCSDGSVQVLAVQSRSTQRQRRLGLARIGDHPPVVVMARF
jgi:hypothetical protein